MQSNHGYYRSSLYTQLDDDLLLSQPDEASDSHPEFYGQYFVVRPMQNNTDSSDHDDAYLQFLAKIGNPADLDGAQETIDQVLAKEATANKDGGKLASAIKISKLLIHPQLVNISHVMANDELAAKNVKNGLYSKDLSLEV